MAGLYIHIPFCRRQCYYCDFHFTVSLKYKDRMLRALEKELSQRKDELDGQEFQTVYIGGGTPSILSIHELEGIVSALYRTFRIHASAEFTLEANPDDLDKVYTESLKKYTPVNRLSIGVQSFIDRDLKFMNRLHTSNEALVSIENSISAGFKNINIDLIYGIPALSIKEWKKNLAIFKHLGIPHLSAYHLTIEPHTVFAYFRKKGQIKELPEEESIRQFKTLIEFAGEEGFEHYEISNFARPGYHSKHNMGYWTGIPYLGIGPSAHSFDGSKRRWNVANNTTYMHSIENGTNAYYGSEWIDTSKAYNEYVMTALRTMWGIDLDHIGKHFGKQQRDRLLLEAGTFIRSGILMHSRENLCLSNEGKMIADYVISALLAI